MKKLIDSILTLGKVAVRSKRVPKFPGESLWNPSGSGHRVLVVMGNGPSLAETLSQKKETLMGCDTMAVNFAANTKEFFSLRPRHYVIADPHFFTSNHPNVEKLWVALSKVDWDMTLHIPVSQKRLMARKQGINENPHIETMFFNMTPAEGHGAVCHRLFDRGLAMPRPRNVLIPALMEGIRCGYEEIYIVGADHTWIHTLYVDDANRVVTVQPHFYKEDREELDRIAEAYSGVRLHQVLESMVVAFRSYHQVRGYADKKNVGIYNSTPGSLIDAFIRKPLP